MDDIEPAPPDLSALLAELHKALIPTLGPELTLDLALPRLAPDSNQREEREGPAAIVSLGFGPGPDAVSAWLWLDGALATNLVDKALGGRGQLGIATAAAMPSEAECGALAYLAARAARAFEGLWIRDVYATREKAPPATVIWPLQLRWLGGSGVARLGCAGAWLATSWNAQVGWLDTLSRADLDALEVGDLLISDGVPLSVTTQGLAGSCVLHVAGIADTLRVTLDGSQLEGRCAERSKTRPDELFVMLHDLRLSSANLATLAGGGGIALCHDQTGQVQLKRGEQVLAEAELVQLGSAVAVRIQSLRHAGDAR